MGTAEEDFERAFVRDFGHGYISRRNELMKLYGKFPKISIATWAIIKHA
jgi:hypothetical protein